METSPSTVAAADGLFGSPLTITLARADPAVLHTVTVSCAGMSETLISRSAQYPSLVWTPAVAVYAPLLTDAASAAATITCESFLNGESLGSRSVTVLLRFRDEDLCPVLNAGWVTLTPYHSASDIPYFVRNVSAVQAAFDEDKVDLSGLFGAAIAAFSLTVGGETVSDSPYRSGPLAGACIVTCTVTDTRGHSASESFPLVPLDYLPPQLTGVSAVRCRADGTEDEDGTCVRLRASAARVTLGGKNVSNYVRVEARQAGGDWEQVYEHISAIASNPAAGTGTVGPAYRDQEGGKAVNNRRLTDSLDLLIPKLGSSAFAADRAYELRLTVWDSLSSAVVTVPVPRSAWVMKFRSDGNGVAFGKAPSKDKVLEIPSDWDILRSSESAFSKLAAHTTTISSHGTSISKLESAVSTLQSTVKTLQTNLSAIPKVQRGSVTTGSNGKATVTFPTKFSAAPHVVCSANGASTAGVFDARPSSITATGFTLVLTRSSGSSVTVGTNITCEWIAVGT